MCDVIAHRGPDGAGVRLDGPIGLGHRRLAILDPSPRGAQPMCNEDGTVWVSYNGEIYNFADLREVLKQRGHLFRSQTDTEVIVHAYEEWGTDCLQRFNGIFAWGLWDGRARRLWLVRDRLGVKPCFYSHQKDLLAFGSEIKSLLTLPSVARRIDYQALAYYLAMNWVPAPHTLFAEIRQLLPGHYLLVEQDGTVNDVAYWRLEYREDRHQSEKQWVEQFDALMADAVRLQLVSDVPFGCFLSGGTDSSSIAWWMARSLSGPLKTFSIAFDEEGYDETPYALQVSQAIGSQHFQQTVTADAAAILPKLVWHGEEPTADSSMLAVYHLAQETRRHVTMVQSGDGADEILAGYETYQAYYLARLYRMLPGLLRRGIIAPLVRTLPASYGKVSWDFKLKRFVAGAEHPPEDAHACWRMIFDSDWRRSLLGPVWDRAGAQSDVIDLFRACFARTEARHPLNRMLYVDTTFYLPNDMLVKVDRMTMAHSLEARVPFLDHRVVEFAATVPPGLKLRRLRTKKYLLRAAMRGRLPDRIVGRKKAGFNIPKGIWMRGSLQPFVRDLLSPQAVRSTGLLDAKTVERLLEDHFGGRADYSHQIWCLMTLVLWHDRFHTRRLSRAESQGTGT
jgi:asparagine synthase (glutamine-hydrolysing)